MTHRMSVEFYANTTPSRSSVLLKEATVRKKSNDLEGAILLLREAYTEIARTGAIEKPAVFLRLPMYLQQAGRADEAWGEFNAMLSGHYPLDMRNPSFAPLWQSHIYDKMRLFLAREKKNNKAVFYGALSYLAYGKWLAYQGMAEQFSELRRARKEELQQHINTEAIEAFVSPLLKKAKLGHVTTDLIKVIHHQLECGQSLSLAQAHTDLNAVLFASNV